MDARCEIRDATFGSQAGAFAKGGRESSPSGQIRDKGRKKITEYNLMALVAVSERKKWKSE